jgi:hypothetical protein
MIWGLIEISDTGRVFEPFDDGESWNDIGSRLLWRVLMKTATLFKFLFTQSSQEYLK